MLCPRTTLQRANLIQNIIVGSSNHVEQGKHDFKDAVEGAYKNINMIWRLNNGPVVSKRELHLWSILSKATDILNLKLPILSYWKVAIIHWKSSKYLLAARLLLKTPWTVHQSSTCCTYYGTCNQSSIILKRVRGKKQKQKKWSHLATFLKNKILNFLNIETSSNFKLVQTDHFT